MVCVALPLWHPVKNACDFLTRNSMWSPGEKAAISQVHIVRDHWRLCVWVHKLNVCRARKIERPFLVFDLGDRICNDETPEMIGVGELAGISGNVDASGNNLCFLFQRAYKKLTICKTKQVCSWNLRPVLSYFDNIEAAEFGREVCRLT